jgi:hypothetical protein
MEEVDCIGFDGSDSPDKNLGRGFFSQPELITNHG